MRTISKSRLFTAISLFQLLWADLPAQTIDEIVVTADFRGRTANEIPASISILDRDEIEQLAVQHFEELVNAVPNLNWSGDGHRARYFQIRGVGELAQYQGAPNPSVGFLIDDIDFSGIGTIATLFDIQQVEVLRGPQGTRYGANVDNCHLRMEGRHRDGRRPGHRPRHGATAGLPRRQCFLSDQKTSRTNSVVRARAAAR